MALLVITPSGMHMSTFLCLTLLAKTIQAVLTPALQIMMTVHGSRTLADRFKRGQVVHLVIVVQVNLGHGPSQKM
jgi:hypothetical protein